MKTLYKITLFITFLISASGAFAQTDAARQNGIELYRKGSYREAAEVLEKIVERTPDDASARTYLGFAQVKLGKMKDAVRQLEKSLELKPDQPGARKMLAYALMQRGKLEDSIRQIETMRATTALDAETLYILGLANLRLGKYGESLAAADAAVKLAPESPGAYFLKAQALMNNRDEKTDYASLAAKYGSAADNLGKFIMLSANSSDIPFWRGQQATLKVFAAYYAEKERNREDAEKDAATTAPNSTPLKILAKPRVPYTSHARSAGIAGTLRLLVEFSETGRVEHVLVISSLGYGLDEEAIKAAKSIKFIPQTRDGKPVTTVRPVEYSFSIR